MNGYSSDAHRSHLAGTDDYAPVKSLADSMGEKILTAVANFMLRNSDLQTIPEAHAQLEADANLLRRLAARITNGQSAADVVTYLDDGAADNDIRRAQQEGLAGA